MSKKRNPVADQLQNYKDSKGLGSDRLVTGWGAPIGDKTNSVTVGPRGPLVVEDTVFTDEMAHFDRERIPERVVHAKGAGAYGYFEVTKDITRYCKASVFSHIGKKTPLFIRFSTVGGERGSADTARDPRGFAIKFYTEEGNWDLVGNNTPVFFIRDPIFFPSFIHTQKRNPVTNCKDPDAFWDFITLRQETTHQVCILFSDRGTPVGYRFMHGFSSHTFKMVNDNGEAFYCKFHVKSNQGIKNFTRQQADEMAKEDPDFSTRDLYNSIGEGNFPSWTMHIQIMTFDQAAKCHFNPFDLTKVWSQSQYPLIEVGKVTLNRNPKNYFAEVEQAAFSPANLVPGIEPSPDKMLQGRLFSYHDTHRHRLGTNFHQIPVNCPFRSRVANFQRDGPMVFDGNQDGAPNYFPNSFSGPLDNKQKFSTHVTQITGDVARHESGNEDNYNQVTDFWVRVLKKDEKERLVDNIAAHASDAQPFLQERVIQQFTKVHPDFGKAVRDRLYFYNRQPAKKLCHL